MYCKECGKQLPDGSVQCLYCGTQLKPQAQDKSLYETQVAFNPPPVSPPPEDKPKSKRTKGIIISIVIALFVAILAVLFIFVIKPKIDEKREPNSDETTVNATLSYSSEVTTSQSEEESQTNYTEKTTKRESSTNSEKTSKKSESEKTNTNNKVDNSDKDVNDDNAVVLPPEIDSNPQQTKLDEAYTLLDDLLYTIEWGSDAEVDNILKNNCGLSYSNPEDKLVADIVKSTIPYFTYEIWAYEQLDENTYDFFIDIYTVDFYDVSDAFANEVLAYAEELYLQGYEPTQAEIEQKFTQLYLDAFDYNDHDSVVTSTYVTMSYVNGNWKIDAVSDIFAAMLCDYDVALDYAEEIIYEGLEELENRYNNGIIYDDPVDVYA